MIRKNSRTVNVTHKNKFIKFSEIDNKPLGKDHDSSVIYLERIKLQRCVQEILTLGHKQPVRNKFKEFHFLANVDIFFSFLR